MPLSLGSAVYFLRADNKDFNKKLDSAKSKAASMVKSTGRALAGLGKAMTVGAAAVGGLVAVTVKAANEQAAAEAQLAAVLKSTGEAAGFSADELKKHASALQSTTTFGDEAIIKGQSLLLTFTNIKETLPEATQTMLDMSQALGQDMKSSAVQIGKALNDPIKGVTALSRVGVTFTDQQKEQIKTLVESGNTMKAQKLILAELNKEFGGSAAAAASTFGGKITQLKNTFGDILEQIGAAFFPVLQKVADFIRPILDRVAEWINNNQGLVVTIATVAASLAGLAAVLGPILVALPVIGVAISAVGALFTPMGAAIAAVVAIIIGLGAAFVANKDKVVAAVNSIKDKVTEWIDQNREKINEFKDNFIKVWEPLWQRAKELFNSAVDFILSKVVDEWIPFMLASVSEFMDWWNANWPIVREVAISTWEAIEAGIKTIWLIIQKFIKAGLDLFTTDWKRVWEEVQDFFINIWNNIQKAVEDTWNGIVNFLTTQIETVVNIFDRLKNKIDGIISDILSSIPGLNRVIGGIDDFVGGFGGSRNFSLNSRPVQSSSQQVQQPSSATHMTFNVTFNDSFVGPEEAARRFVKEVVAPEFSKLRFTEQI